MPAAPTLTNPAVGQAAADWPNLSGAISSRTFKQIVGTDLDFVDAGPTMNSQTTFTNLSPGETFRVKVSASNAVGESVPGPYAEIVLPAPPP